MLFITQLREDEETEMQSGAVSAAVAVRLFTEIHS